MKYADIAGLTEKELSKKARDLRHKMFEANMKNALGQLTNPMTIREMRRDIARYNTALTAKAHSASGGGEKSAVTAKAAKAAPKKASTAKKTSKVAKTKA